MTLRETVRLRSDRTRSVTAILGPTNTGKTHYAIERMLGHASGAIGLPLRLLAREVYNRVVERAGPEAVALITGEEKIKPRAPRYWVATVEAMPRDLDVAFVAVDEVQLAADLDRGHVFTDRLLNRRGLEETLVIGAATIRPAIEELLPEATITTRPRLSKLTFAGDRKISRLPGRSAIVAFSAEEVYSIAEFIRRQRGGAAVVLGALSPRTRNAQVDLYQNGEVDYIVATDAIGMGLNLDVDYVAFASDRKFDGWQFRRLTPAEFAQIAGRAGRNARDGQFGTTGRCPPFGPELAEQIEDHAFDPIGMLQWRSADLDFDTIASLQASLETQPNHPRLVRAPLAEDVLVLDLLAHDPFVQKQTKTRADVQRLWDVCQVPDYRKTSPAAHADLARALFGFVLRAGRIPDDWFSAQLAACDRPEGEIDALSARIAQVRTLNFIANRPDWLGDPEHWQGLTRRVEDTLSDALHERLAARFVDRRTSVLMRRLREFGMLEAEVTSSGDVLVEGQHVGNLLGFRFTPDPVSEGEASRTLNAAAQKALAAEIESRAARINEAVDTAFLLTNDGTIRWLGEAVGKVVAGDHIMSPGVRLLADEQLTGAALEMAQMRLDLWVQQHIAKLLGPLRLLEQGEELEGAARGVAFQVAEALGVLERSRVAQDIRGLNQDARARLRKLGLRFGAYHIYAPALLKPAPRALAALLWALKHGGLETVKGFDEVVHLASSGRTSFPADPAAPKALYLVAGFRVSGERAVRVDMLERLADLVRPAVAYRPGVTPGDPPLGAADDDGFVVSTAMTSLVGCSGEAFASILRSLGYVSEVRPGPAITRPIVPAAPKAPLAPAESRRAESGEGHATAEADSLEAIGAGAGPSGSELRDAAATEEAAAAPEAPADERPEASESRLVDVSLAPPPAQPFARRPDEEAAEPQVEPEPAADSADLRATLEDEARADASAAEAQASAEQASGEAGAEAPPAAEPAPAIEIWRPQRRSFGQRRPRREGGRAFVAAPRSEAAAPAVDAGAERPKWRERRDQRGGRRRHEAGEEKVAANGGEPGASRPEPGRNRKFSKDKPERSDRSFASAGERPRRERAPDPDSPFAKLAALKAELEAKARKET